MDRERERWGKLWKSLLMLRNAEALMPIFIKKSFRFLNASAYDARFNDLSMNKNHTKN